MTDEEWEEYRNHPCYQGESRECVEEMRQGRAARQAARQAKWLERRLPYVPPWAVPLR